MPSYNATVFLVVRARVSGICADNAEEAGKIALERDWYSALSREVGTHGVDWVDYDDTELRAVLVDEYTRPPEERDEYEEPKSDWMIERCSGDLIPFPADRGSLVVE